MITQTEHQTKPKKYKQLIDEFEKVRTHTEKLCEPLLTEDYVVQPHPDVSPPKWHLGHTTWFFETMVLKPFFKDYKEFHSQYDYVFNSYYETVGARVIRTDRGNLSRPAVMDIYKYRKHVDKAMKTFFQNDLSEEQRNIVITGLNHEQQHQELLLSDIKYILGNNPLFPVYDPSFENRTPSPENGYTKMKSGLYEIGYKGSGFCFDNELQPHQVYLNEYEISNHLVTNEEYLGFMQDGGYKNFNYWHAEGWDWVKKNNINSPLYWYKTGGDWHEYTLSGLHPVDPDGVLQHISYYEAFAFAQWKGQRLPTEFEWEVAADKLNWGLRWEWTESSYLPYPGFKKLPGALGEYNGKFMVSQKVLRGASIATPEGHSRKTYRNFFYPQQRWQFTGIRLAK